MGDNEVVDTVLYSLDGTNVTVLRLLVVGAVVLVGYLVIALFCRALQKRMEAREGTAAAATAIVVRRLVQGLMTTLLLVVSLELLGIAVSTVFAAGAVVFLGVGLALQKIMMSFVAGVLLLVEREVEPGDVIATGTPPGVGFARKPPVYLKAGDVCEVEIDGLGVLRNPVAAFEA